MKEWLPAVEAQRKTIAVKKNTVIFTEGQPVEGIYFVNEGKVKVHKKWGQDKELILRIAGKGAILGHRGLGKSMRYPVSGTALETSSLCFISMDFFLATIKVNQAFAFQLMMFFAEELQESEKNMRNLAHMTVKGRLAQSLMMLRDTFGQTPDGAIAITLSRQDLASLAGTTYETVFRIMTELVQEEIISLTNKDICILDNDRLVRLTDEAI
ncbi:MAG TPA: Crp/Fnr family transcriptional regulator [Chitinophagaceae bacterium]|jgi:CRP-like cAMP-binding protein|nr:Crp/Fnr family transcriptional regulator [Chitinophagaceae bacterium]